MRRTRNKLTRRQLADLNRRISRRVNQEMKRIDRPLSSDRPKPLDPPKFLCQDIRNWKVPTHCNTCGDKLNPNLDYFDQCKRCSLEWDETHDENGRRIPLCLE